MSRPKYSPITLNESRAKSSTYPTQSLHPRIPPNYHITANLETSNHKQINTRDDAIAQLATSYEQSEIAYFKHLVDSMLRHARQAYWISSMNAATEVARVPDTSKRLKASEAEELLEKLVTDGWLRREYVFDHNLTIQTQLLFPRDSCSRRVASIHH
jgi:hypothetical protein